MMKRMFGRLSAAIAAERKQKATKATKRREGRRMVMGAPHWLERRHRRIQSTYQETLRTSAAVAAAASWSCAGQANFAGWLEHEYARCERETVTAFRDGMAADRMKREGQFHGG